MKLEELEEDPYLRTLFQEMAPGPTLPPDFTAKVMSVVETEAPEYVTLYQPLISRQAWQTILLLLGLLLVVTGLLSCLPFMAGLMPREVPLADWLGQAELLPRSRRFLLTTQVGGHLVAAGGICLIYLLLDKWRGAGWPQQQTSR